MIRRVLVASFLVGLVSIALGAAHARPVRVGRFVEIPFGVSGQHPWRTGGGGPTRMGLSEMRVPSKAPTRVWATRVGVGRVFAPAITESGTLYVGSQSGVTAVSQDGEVDWTVRLGLVSGTPSITPEGHVAVGAQPGDLVIAGGGQAVHRTRIGGAVRGSPLVLDDGSVVVAAYDGAVHRFDAEGRTMFRTPIPAVVRGAPALVAGEIVVPSGAEVLWMNLQGEIIRRVAIDGNITLGPAGARDDAIWVLSERGTLFAIASSGRVASTTELGIRPSVASSLAIGPDGSVRFGSIDSGLICVGSSGTERWRLESEGHITGGVVVDADGTTLALTQGGRLLAVDSRGHVSWRVEANARSDSPPVIGADGTIYVSTYGGELQAWRR